MELWPRYLGWVESEMKKHAATVCGCVHVDWFTLVLLVRPVLYLFYNHTLTIWNVQYFHL